MAYIQKSTPPPNKVMTFSLRNFVGGLNNRSEQLEDNEASSLMNMMFADDTIMENRFGQKFYDEVELDGEIVFIDEFKPYNDEKVLIRGTENSLYIEDQILTDLQGRPHGVTHSGRYFFADGDKLYVYGRFAQAESTYEKITGTPIDDYVLFEIVSPADGHARLGTEHVRGVLRVNYTNYTVCYEPCENEFTDNYKGANKVPVNIKYIVSHNGRLFVSGDKEDDDNVFISHVQNPFYFPVSLPLQLTPNSDKIVGMCVYDNSVVVGRKDDIYVIHGNTNRPDMGVPVFQLRKINSHTGFANHDAVNIAHNHLFFLGSDGNAYALASTKYDEKVLATSILTQNIDIEKAPINVLISDVDTACSIFHNDEWYVSVGDKVLVYSYRHRQWTVYNKINATSFYIKNREVIWGRKDGRTAMFDKETFLDFGVPYESHWYSKRFDMDDANSFKQFREFFLVAHTFEDYPSDINVIFEIDYSDVKDRVVVTNQISVWGKSRWGDRLITRNIVDSIPFIIGRRGRTIRFKIFCGYDVHGEVDTHADLEYYIGRIDGVLVKVLDEDRHYLYMNREWLLMDSEDLNQRMKLYQINGDYEMRGKR